MDIGIWSIEYALPRRVVTNDELAAQYSGWTADRILAKTGIEARHVAAEDECASDLAEMAAKKLFECGVVAPTDIDFVLMATQSPDYFLPTTACILQDRLGIPPSAGALDFNLGCSAYVYGLAIAKGLIRIGAATNVLFLTAETYTKYIHPLDRSTRTIFGDAAAATLVSYGGHNIGDFDLGTDGSGKEMLIVPSGGARQPRTKSTAEEYEDDGSIRSRDHIYMNGPEVFNFTSRVVPRSVMNVLRKHNLGLDDVDLFVFHQANQFMLEHLRRKIGIPQEKFFVDIRDIGNTVSSTIPIALRRAEQAGRLRQGDRVVICGFGVGLSWGSTVLIW